ncbi:hypothetical protein RUND412_003608 [Rhizina undulata]
MDSGISYSVLELDRTFANDSGCDANAYESSLEAEIDINSLLSTALNHTYENGRRYHGYKAGKYLIPNDEMEQERMELFHHTCMLAIEGNVLAAPVGKDWNPRRILDLGTGSGMWAIEAADQFPEAEIMGVDLSPIQPRWVPPNVSFVVDDIEEPWPYEDNSYDLIHIRHMAGHLEDWPRLYRQALKALKPGGWIEVQECCDYASCDDGSLPADSALSEYIANFEQVTVISGKLHNSVALSVAADLKDLGYVDVGQRMVKLPIGRWPKGDREKEMGVFWRQAYLEGAEAYALAPYTRVLGWSKQMVEEFLVRVYADLKKTKYHAYSKLVFSYGRKPCA